MVVARELLVLFLAVGSAGYDDDDVDGWRLREREGGKGSSFIWTNSMVC